LRGQPPMRRLWPSPQPSVEVLTLRAERDRFRAIAEIAVQALELTQGLIMGIGDTKQGAEWEQERAVNQVKAIADNIAADLKELGPALSDVVTASASQAAVQSASSIVMYNKRLEEIEARVSRLREDMADLKTRIAELERLVGGP
jgi:ubiquinone biosynthesis protein UbiJ